MTRCYLVCYDICDEKRLRRIHKTMKGFGVPWQYSIFFCMLRDIDRVRMKTALEMEMNQKEDSVFIVDLGADETNAKKAVTVIGQSQLPEEHDVIVF